jgi:hypothetical protein
MKNADGAHGRTQKKVYVEPRLEKAQKLEDVTQGVAPVVTGAAPAD